MSRSVVVAFLAALLFCAGAASAQTPPKYGAAPLTTAILGAPNGAASLDGTGHLAAAQLPGTVITSSQVGAASGVAQLDSAVRLPAVELPVSALTASLLGVANGIASLDSSGRMSTAQLPAAAMLSTNSLDEISAAGTQAIALFNLGTVAHVSSSAALEALPTAHMTAGTILYKDGYYAAGDMDPLVYALQNSPCSLNVGGGDGFSQFSATGGTQCWVLSTATTNIFSVAQAGVVENSTDPNGNNAAQLNAIFQFNHSQHVSGAFEAPNLILDGRQIGISAPVTITSGFMNFMGTLSLKALNNLGGGIPNPTMPAGSGNWCPAMLTVETNSGVKLLNNILFDGNYQPVYLFDNEINGTQQYNHLFGKHWQGSCGGPTPLNGTITAGSPIITMASTAGYAVGQQIHNMFPVIPYLSYITAVDANTDIVLNQPANQTPGAPVPINAYNDSGGAEAGAFGNAGGQLSFSNFNEYQTGDVNLGNAALTYGNSYSMWPGANDIYLSGGLYENAVCGIYMSSGGGGIHIVGDPEVTNDAWNIAKASSGTISGTTMVLAGTITNPPFQVGMVVAGTGISDFPTITAVPTGGGAGTYTISSPETVSTPELLTGTFNVKNPCALGMADNAGNVEVQAMDFGGDVVQITVDSANVQNFLGGMLKWTGSANSTISPAYIVQIQNINQSNPNLKNITVDLLQSNLIGSLGLVSNTNYGTGTYTGMLNTFSGPFNLSGEMNFNGSGGLTGDLLQVGSYSANYTALLPDSGGDYHWSNNATSYTTTMPNSLPQGWWVKFDADAIGSSTNTLAVASGASLNGTAGGTVIVPANTPGEIHDLANSDGASAKYSVNFLGFQRVSHSPTGAYAFQLSDCGEIVAGSNGTNPETYTVQQITLGNIQGCVFDLIIKGSGTVTLVNGSGVTLDGSTSFSQALVSGDSYRLSTTDGAVWGISGPGLGGVTSVAAGTGLSASPSPIKGSGTLSIANTAVAAGSYGSASAIPYFTVNAQGQLTAAGSVTITSGGLISILGYTPVNPASAAITGGTINGTSIGGTTAAAGAFTNLSASGLVSGPGFAALQVGQLVGIQTFASGSCSGGCTYTPDTGTIEVVVEAVGAGAGAGSAAATGSGQSAIGMGAGAGSYAKVLLTSGFSGVTVTTPAGGAGGTSGGAGSTGGTASFGSIISCPGGVLGAAGGVHSSVTIGGVTGRASPCTNSAGTLLASVPGATSTSGLIVSPGTAAQSGGGANDPLGTGGAPVGAATQAGNNAAGSGAGGSGGVNQNASEATAVSGGSGSGAQVNVFEYN